LRSFHDEVRQAALDPPQRRVARFIAEGEDGDAPIRLREETRR
jgi:hypothetical protein